MKFEEPCNIHYLLSDISFSGIYFLVDAGEVVYVGQTSEGIKRISCHIKDKKFEEVFIIPTPQDRLDDVEWDFIYKYQPKYNFKGTMHGRKEGNSLPYIAKENGIKYDELLGVFREAVRFNIVHTIDVQSFHKRLDTENTQKLVQYYKDNKNKIKITGMNRNVLAIRKLADKCDLTTGQMERFLAEDAQHIIPLIIDGTARYTLEQVEKIQELVRKKGLCRRTGNYRYKRHN